MSGVEIAGYIASFFVAVSLLMSSFLLLRILNLIGALFFVAYGALLGSFPIVLTNSFITVIDTYYLFQLFRPRVDGFDYVAVRSERRNQVEEFVLAHIEDIQVYFPDFSLDLLGLTLESGGTVYLARHDLAIQGFALCFPVPLPDRISNPDLSELFRIVHTELFPEESVVLPVDYVVRKYRGIGLTHRLYDRIETQKKDSVRFILAPVQRRAKAHARYLKKQGFAPVRVAGEYTLLFKEIGS